MKIISISYQEYYEKLLEYMELYGSYYDEEDKAIIFNNFLKYNDIHENNCDLLNQVYQVTGIFDLVKDNTYDCFLKELEKRFDINRSLLDVGCGYYPAFAEKIADYQKYGSVDAIDPKVVTTNIQGVNVRREEIDAYYDLSGYDLIYSIQPCDATFDMIRAANIQDKDLCFLPCSCGKTYMGQMNMKMYLKFVEQLLKQSLPKTREYKIEYVKAFKQPIISTRKNK